MAGNVVSETESYAKEIVMRTSGSDLRRQKNKNKHVTVLFFVMF